MMGVKRRPKAQKSWFHGAPHPTGLQSCCGGEWPIGEREAAPVGPLHVLTRGGLSEAWG